MTADAIIGLATAIGQLGLGAAALKAVIELKRAVNVLADKSDNHEKRITKLEEK